MKKIYMVFVFLLLSAGYSFSQDVPSAGPIPLGTQTDSKAPFIDGNFDFDGVETAFAFQTFPTPTQYVTFPIPGYTPTVVGPGTFTDFASSGVFAPNGTFFLTTAGDVTGNGQLWTVNTSTGVATLRGTMTGVTNVNGITVDPTTGIFYVATSSSLYTVDTTTGAATLVGPFNNTGGLMAEIAMDCNGVMYAVDLGLDNTYTVNKATGAITLLGPLGFNLNFGCGMTYDKVNDILYLFGLDGAGNINALRTINTTTGASTTLHTWSPTLSQFAPFDIVGNGSACGGSGGGTLCFNRSGLNLAIPDNNIATGVRDTINVTNNGGPITDITVVIGDIQHTWIGDMITELSHSGQTDTLFSRIGTGGFGNSSDNMLNVRFTDSATVPINTLDNTTSPSGGTFLPGGRTGVDSLRKHFATQNIAGPWVLWIRDAAAGDLGTLQAWSICFYGGPFTQIISNNNQTPDRYSLEQNYPNPFNPTTKIKFALPKAGLVSLKVYDMLGREVQTLINQQLNAGEFIADFDGANLSSGTYFYRLQVGDFVQIKKMVLLK